MFTKIIVLRPIFVLLLVRISLGTAPTWTQEAAPDVKSAISSPAAISQSDFPFWFIAFDKRGEVVRDLAVADVIVHEEGASKPCSTLRLQSGLPLRLIFLIDVSGSTREHKLMSEARLRVAEFVRRGLQDQDQAAVVEFADQVYIDQLLTKNRDMAEKAIRSIRGGRGGTALYDAVLSASQYLAKQTEPDGVRRGIVLLTDGEDNATACFKNRFGLKLATYA